MVLAAGAGGWFLLFNGRIWEAIQAPLERRRPLALYHSALEVHLPEGRFVVEAGPGSGHGPGIEPRHGRAAAQVAGSVRSSSEVSW